jgi:hypothetical protein
MARRRRKSRRRNPRLKFKYYKRPGKKRRRRAAAKRGGRRRTRRPRRRAHYSSYRALSRRRGPRRAARIWRKRRKYVRGNPLKGFMPSIGGVTDVLKMGAGVGVGYVAVNGVLLLADKFFLASFKAGKSPMTVALINAGVRALVGVPLAGMLGKAVLGQKFASSIYAGAAFNVVQHAILDANAVASFIPEGYSGLLLDYGQAAGMYDYVNSGTGVRDYLADGGVNAGAMTLPTANDTPDEVGAFL